MAVGFPTKANWAAGDVLTASQMDDLAGTLNTVQNFRPWNAVLNSNMSVWQRGTSFAYSGSVAYNADRWCAYNSGTSMTISRQLTNDTTNLPNIQYCMRVQRNAAATNLNPNNVTQSFETINSIPFVGKTVTLSLYARCGSNYSSTGNILSVGLTSGTGTDQNFLSSYTGATTPLFGNAALTTTWQRFSYTGTVPINATELTVQLYNTPTGTAGANDYFEITGVQLELGSVANTYQPNGSTYQAELAACQRYYWRFGGSDVYQGFGQGAFQNSTSAWTAVTYPVPMRANGIQLDYSTLALYDYASIIPITGVSANILTPNCARILFTVASGGTTYRPVQILSNNSTSGYIGVSAEL